jgi:archaellin
VATPLGRADSDSFMEMGETFEIKLIGIESGGANGLTSNLITNTTFSLEVIPPVGAVLHLERTTPAWFNCTDNLD